MSPILPHEPPLAIARQALHADEPLPAGLLSPSVQRSWERARAAGIRPQDQALFQHYVSLPEMRRVQEHHHSLIELARPDLEQLWHSVRSPDWVVLLTDPHGTIVHSLGAHERAPKELRMPLRAGRRLHEGELGTTAPSVVANEGIAAEVRGEEHFLMELRRLSCAAAPIFGMEGQVIGVLDITGFDVPWDHRVLERVQIACHSIESRLFEQAQDGMLVRFHEDPRFLGTPAQGMLWLREDGRILAANRMAKKMLGMQACASDMQVHIHEVFDWSNRAADSAMGNAEHLHSLPHHSTPIYTRHGVRFFMHIEARTQRKTRQNTAHTSTGNAVAPTTPEASRTRTNELTDPQWQLAFDRAIRILPSGLPVLLQGETGTGKEWFSRSLHEACRHGKPFVAINCAALADGVAEAELFGYVEGAFTGSRKGGAPGRLEQAHRGTLFLDEIGDMPPHLQTRLLRVLQERHVTRVGSGEEIALDILVIAASHRDLQQLVNEGQFREDLYFRLHGLKVLLPALRQRSDIDPLIDLQLQQLSTALKRPIYLCHTVRPSLHAYPWPGNIRQLQHVLQVGALLTDESGVITASTLPPEVLTNQHQRINQANLNSTPSSAPKPAATLLRQKHLSIEEALAAHAGNVSATAKALGVSRTTVYKHLALMRNPDSPPGSSLS